MDKEELLLRLFSDFIPRNFTSLISIYYKELTMNSDLLQVTLRQNAIFIKKESTTEEQEINSTLNHTTLVLVANASKLGFGFSEALLHAINGLSVSQKKEILLYLQKIMGVGKNWTPLVKGWDEPTNERLIDHLVTAFANLMPKSKGVVLPCGHSIPPNTFPLERYNGCPYCGTPFLLDDTIYTSQNSKLKILELWQEEEMERYMVNLLSSKTPLDATQEANIEMLLNIFPLPKKVTIEMKETEVLVIDLLVKQGKLKEAGELFGSPNDILRYLWYKHTGFLQIVQPKVIVRRTMFNSQYAYDDIEIAKEKAIEELKLKYSRKECKMVASWLNGLAMKVEMSCENMHPKRAMWVRFIRALRLAEYAKKEEFTKLRTLLDVFYNKKYNLWQGQVDMAKKSMNEARYFELLKERPSLFARSLFSSMLWFGEEQTTNAFLEVSDKIPARLLLTLGMYAELYFDVNQSRTVKPLGGVNKNIPANQFLGLYDAEALKNMQESVEQIFFVEMSRRYEKLTSTAKSIYIDALLKNVPLSIGDRTQSVQDMPSALMGEKFSVEGESVRLFMQWGEGLPAQHLDMDLSCKVAFDGHEEECTYYNLTATGCKHSGDIQQIPHMKGTAEYIELNLNELERAGANYVTFTGNAYTSGTLEPNMVIGWMNSKEKMKISHKSGVAYDPSCVQHQIRITQSLTKGIVFGVLDVKEREITWLEMSFHGQTIRTLDTNGVEALLAKLDSKMSVAELLELRAKAQGVEVVQDETFADEVYDTAWLMEGSVNELLVD